MVRRILCIILALSMLMLCGCGAGLIDELLEQIVPMPDLNVVPYRQLRYLIGQLDEQTYANLCAIYEGALSFSQWCTLPYPIPAEELSDLLPIVRYECPELIQLDLTGSVTYRTRNNMAVQLELPLTMTREEYEEKYAACVSVIDSLVQSTRGMTDRDKEKYVYDYITANCIYDAESEHADDPYGCLVEGYAKCDGISLSMKWALEAMGIRCLCLAGEPVEGTVGHAWNVVELDGVFYDLDVTADVPKPEDERIVLYPAFNVSQSWIRQHYYVDAPLAAFGPLPGTDSMAMSYHAQNGDFIYQGQEPDLEKRFLDAYETAGSFTLQFESAEAYTSFMDTLEETIDRIGYANELPGWAWKYYTQEDHSIITMQVSQP